MQRRELCYYELQVGKNVETVVAQYKVPSHYSSGGTEANHECP